MIGHRLMLNLYPRLATDGAAAALDDDEPHICYAIMVAFVSLLLFCVLLAVFSPAKACAITSLIVLLFALVTCLAPTRGVGVAAARGDGTRRQPAVPALRLVRRCTCGLTDAAIAALPTFTYESPAATDQGGGQCGDEEPHGSFAQLLCAVCLEDVRDGETVRQLPPCRHLFHVDCIDLWLHTHRTCPLCRCELSPRKVTAKAVAAAAAATDSSAHPLPPV